ncbi:ATP synthase regulation protein NCA2-domain-containing protein [Lasiosphaeria ovina]|uniref:ATP synthase regulation protein NCA2-domain-containing protein n=1 Tax=Lasiosphaeria ovina TaxID=92902 RepID=A0AAE0N377_9PEZI|nr:ATP synthase regulation protein NCA2-domain-containing protein [Lasiosphaeria ovina]
MQSGLLTEDDTLATYPPVVKTKTDYESDIEWLLVGKATVQTFGLVMSTLLDDIIPLGNDIWYWDEILGSYSNSALYTVQTSPLRMWWWSKEIYYDSISRFQSLNRATPPNEIVHDDDEFFRSPVPGELITHAHTFGTKHHTDSDNSDEVSGAGGTDGAGDEGPDLEVDLSPTLSRQWRQFYSIVRASIAERSITDLRRRLFSRVDVCRAEAQEKRQQLCQLREMSAAGLGILMGEGLRFGQPHALRDENEWKSVLEQSVVLMDMILKNTLSLESNLQEFEEKIFNSVKEDPGLIMQAYNTVEAEAERPAVLARRIFYLLQQGIPGHVWSMNQLARHNGRPSRLVRYWPVAVALIVSSSTILRILVNRQDDIVNWIRGLGATTRDFWFNWVVEPVRKIIGTIRRDTNSEIAIMSRDSLKADRESLERMVVDFACDNPNVAVGASSITDSQIAEIRSKVKEGDVTPVLRAYEKDMKQPFVGAIKGDLVRSLLIQVQKTKVDLEVAISGIDALLKSQELVFGFVGLTPGIFVAIGVFQYLRTILGGRKSVSKSRKARSSVRVLRNIDRIFSASTVGQLTGGSLISYKDHGLLLCEIHALRKLAHDVLPRDMRKEFIEDLDELGNLSKGTKMQMRVLDRIHWAYAEWLVKIR